MDLKKEVKELVIAVIVVWVIYQGISILLGTAVPVTSIVSSSMEHPLDLDEWWTENQEKYHKYEITKEEFNSYSFRNGLYIGDMIVVMNSEIKQGDVIVYHPKEGCFPKISSRDTIIHRVISVDPIITKGDNNRNPDLINGESCILSIEGKAILGAPLVGYPRLLLFWTAGI